MISQRFACLRRLDRVEDDVAHLPRVMLVTQNGTVICAFDQRELDVEDVRVTNSIYAPPASHDVQQRRLLAVPIAHSDTPPYLLRYAA